MKGKKTQWRAIHTAHNTRHRRRLNCRRIEETFWSKLKFECSQTIHLAGEGSPPAKNVNEKGLVCMSCLADSPPRTHKLTVPVMLVFTYPGVDVSPVMGHRVDA